MLDKIRLINKLSLLKTINKYYYLSHLNLNNNYNQLSFGGTYFSFDSVKMDRTENPDQKIVGVDCQNEYNVDKSLKLNKTRVVCSSDTDSNNSKKSKSHKPIQYTKADVSPEDNNVVPLARASTTPILKIKSKLNPNAAEFISRSYSSSSSVSYSTIKERYLNMDIESKRKFYKCKDYITIVDIDHWEDYFKKNETKFSSNEITDKEIEKIFKGKLFQPDQDLNTKVSILISDITSLEIDCIVNAANSGLIPGAGVCGAIYRGAGCDLERETRSIGHCATGDAVISGGYLLPSKYVIHAVGPMGECKDELESCYTRIVEVTVQNKQRTVAIPCISTGIYGYPNERASIVAIETIRRALEKHRDSIDRVIFVLFLKNDVELYHKYMPYFFPNDLNDKSSQK